jgi:hypothetical protein
MDDCAYPRRHAHEAEGIEDRRVSGLTIAQLLKLRQAVRPEHNRLAVDREALGFDPYCTYPQ